MASATARHNTDTLGTVRRLVDEFTGTSVATNASIGRIHDLQASLESGDGGDTVDTAQRLKDAYEEYEDESNKNIAKLDVIIITMDRSNVDSPLSSPDTPLDSEAGLASGPSSTLASTYTPVDAFPNASRLMRYIQSQLPFAPGRQVAFRVPPGTDWILAKIVNRVDNKYIVQDVDADPTSGQYTTGIDRIVPLPDPKTKPLSYPNYDIPPGTTVLALYPDTTSFYRATLVSGPENERGKRGARVYRLKFDDDDDKTRSVPIEFVVEKP